ncbi:MAG TPA: hypothetical protein PLU53_15005 [Bacteroidia bacterium]|nr:hypothetical protein [Bacteroidia bacterium]
MKEPKLTPVGFISKVHGYKGYVVLALENITPAALKTSNFIFVEMDGLPVPFRIEDLSEKGDDVIVKFELINDESQAKKIVRQPVFAEKLTVREDLALDWPDLAGFTAIDTSYGSLGVIEEVEELPMQWIAHCKVNEKEVLFPLNEQVIVEVDERKKQIILNLPDGLIQVYLEM